MAIPGMIGADVDELTRLADQFKGSAGQITSVESRLTPRISHAPWRGPAADRFRHDWMNRDRKLLLAAAQALTDAAALLRENARQQDRASSANAPGGGITAGQVLSSLEKGLTYLQLMNPATMPFAAMKFAPQVMRALHLKEVRIGDSHNHVILSPDGTVSVKVDAINTEVTTNESDGSFVAKYEGLGLERTKDGAYGVTATPGINWGPLHLDAGLAATYNPKTGVVTPEGNYQVGIDHIAETDGYYRHAFNPVTGQETVETGYGVEALGARHQGDAVEKNGEFQSLTTTDSISEGGVTVQRVHSQALSGDGTFTDSTATTESYAPTASIDTPYFAVTADVPAIGHTDVESTSTTADGTRTTTSTSTNFGPGSGR